MIRRPPRSTLFPSRRSSDLGLANNQIEWKELQKIRQLQVISLNLQGNSQLSSDPHYRNHVIDCLPLVWALDGDLITSADRRQVEQFFEASALTTQPVRHKFSSHVFITSSARKQKKLLTSDQNHKPPDGIYGRWYDERTRGTFCKWIDEICKEF